MRVFSWFLCLAGCLSLGLTGCDQTREGEQVLLDQPGIAARFTVGVTREAEARALLGEPRGTIAGIVVAGNQFYQLTEEVKAPGVPVTQWRYWARRKAVIGPWPFARRQEDNASLGLAFDAAGVLRHVSHHEHHGGWEKEGVITKLF